MQLKFGASGSLAGRGAAHHVEPGFVRRILRLCESQHGDLVLGDQFVEGRLRWARNAEIVADTSSCKRRRNRDRWGWLRAPSSVSRTRAALNGSSGNCRPAAMSSASMSWVVVGVASPPRQQARMPASSARPNDARRSSNVLQRDLITIAETRRP